MREGLAREFPGAARTIAVTWARVRTRRTVLWSEPVLWATISGIGAGLIVSQLMQFLAALAFHTLSPFVSGFGMATLSPFVTLTATAVGASVALCVGGPLALALYLAYLAIGVGFGIPGMITFCERSGGRLGLPGPDRCSVTGFVASLWPQILGVGLGLAFARGITTRGTGINSVLRVAGAYAIALSVVTQVSAAAVAQAWTPVTSVLTISVGTAAAAAAGGVVAAQLPRGVRNALIVAGVALLPWLTLQLPLALQSLGPTGDAQWVQLILVSLVTQPIASAVLVLSAAVAARSRFIPREAP
ncbi:MAG: hypothetical protein ACRDF9_09760 [Candidatus Limnocylindria bacterium]